MVPFPADGMARLSTSHEPMGGVGNGTGMEALHGAMRIFLEEDAVRSIVSAAHEGCGPDPLMRDL
jgi:hypothetical protein